MSTRETLPVNVARREMLERLVEPAGLTVWSAGSTNRARRLSDGSN